MSRSADNALCRALIQRLSELESERARILRHLSHELKTPLAAFREGVSLLREELAGPLTPRQREVLAILEGSTRTLQRQIEELLHYHATVLSASRLQLCRTDLRELLESVVEGHRLQIHAQRLTVRVDCAATEARVDPEKMRTAIGNLLSNAIDFSPPDGEIVLRASLGGAKRDTLSIDCIDPGAGVAEADARRIFDPFVQGGRRPASGRQGSGVGLSIVREIAIIHGGRAFVVPTAQGAHFRMELPNESRP